MLIVIIAAEEEATQTTKAVVNMLDQLDEWIEDIPLHTSPQRFGNRAFRDWGQRLEEVSSARYTVCPSLVDRLVGFHEIAIGSFPPCLAVTLSFCTPA